MLSSLCLQAADVLLDVEAQESVSFVLVKLLFWEYKAVCEDTSRGKPFVGRPVGVMDQVRSSRTHTTCTFLSFLTVC